MLTSNDLPRFALALVVGVALLALVACSDDDDDDDDHMPGPSFAFRDEDPSAYQRIDRKGRPAIATAVITSKDAYNAADPSDDAAGDFVAEIVARVEALHDALDDDLIAAGLVPAADGVGQAAPLVVPDVVGIDPTVASGFPNGRRLIDPVIDLTLAVVLLDLGVHPVSTLADLPLNPSGNDRPFDAAFPYLASPHTP